MKGGPTGREQNTVPPQSERSPSQNGETRPAEGGARWLTGEKWKDKTERRSQFTVYLTRGPEVKCVRISVSRDTKKGKGIVRERTLNVSFPLRQLDVHFFLRIKTF